MRRRHHLSASRRSDRVGGLQSPASQFPPTPMSESGPQLPSPYPHGDHLGYPSPNIQPGSYGYSNPAQPGFPPHGYGGSSGQYGFDDDLGDDQLADLGSSESGRVTPGGSVNSTRRGPSTRSLPAGDPREQHAGSQPGSLRPRAHTEDASSHVMSQWRTQPPPPMRGMSTTSSNGDAQSLHSSASSRQLRSAPSAEWGGPGPGSLNSSPAVSYARLPHGSTGAGQLGYDADGHPLPRLPPGASHAGMAAGGGGVSAGMSRQGSAGPIMSAQTTPQAPPMFRSRSASSAHAHSAYLNGRSGEISPGQVGDEAARARVRRESGSSHATDRSSASASNSGHSGGRRGMPLSGTSSATSFPSPSHSLPPGAAHNGNAVRVKVYFGDDAFVVVVFDTSSHAELVEKVLKKIRLCGAANAKVEANALRLRYRDEDGDRISITSEEDVTMAFETAKAMAADKGAGAPLELVLFASVDA